MFVAVALVGAASCLSPVKEGTHGGIGPSGGMVSSTEGASIQVPAGALTTQASIAISKVTDGFPTLPSGMTASAVFAATPHGQTFADPVTIRVPANSSQVLITAQPGGAWARVDATFSDGFLVAQVSHFSFFAGADVEPQLDGGPDAGPSTDAGPDNDGGTSSDGGTTDPCDHCTDPSCRVLYSGGYAPHALAADDLYLYWVDAEDAGSSGYIFRMQNDGYLGNFGVLTDVPTSVAALHSDTDNLYWSEFDVPGFFMIHKPAWPHVRYGAGLAPFPDRLVISGEYAFEQSHNYGEYGGTVTRIDVDGGAETTVFSQSAYYELLAADSDNLYLRMNGDLMTVSLDGGAPVLLSSQVEDGNAVLDGDNIYIAGGFIGGSLTRISKLTGAQTVLATGLNQPIGLTLDSTAAYMGTGEGITKVDRNTGALSILVPDPLDGGGAGGVTNIAIDQYYVYWTNLFCGTVSRRSK